MSNSQIQVNPHGIKMWRMDAGGFQVIALASYRNGVMDGINLKGSNGKAGSDVWMDMEEAKSLRDWLNSNLPA
jgi:hypothetical protein